MYKVSCFNSYCKSTYKESIIFNSFTEKMVIIHNKKIENKEELIRFFDITNKENKENLLEYGLIVGENDNEYRIASLKYLDKLYNKDLYLMILPTYNCNFRCRYCYENFGNEFLSFPEIELSKIDENRIMMFIKKYLSSYYCLTIEWHGGEPLLKSDIINSLSEKIIKLTSYMRKPFIATITTNGYYLTEDMVRKMLRNHVIKFHVTLDGFEWNHNFYRPDKNGKNTFDIIIKNLLNIKQNIKQKNFHIVLRTNITKSFLPHLGEWLKFLSHNFSDDKRFQIYIKMVEDKGGTAINQLEDELMESEKEIYSIIRKTSYKNNYEFYYSLLCNSVCSAAMRNKYIFAPEGKVKKCGHFLFDSRTDIGILQDNGIIAFDRDMFSKWITLNEVKGKCKNCPLWGACFNSFCPLKVNFQEKKESVCSGEHKNLQEIVEILTSDYNTQKDFLIHIN